VRWLSTALLSLALTASAHAASPADSLVGTTLPEWQVRRWLNSAPLRLADLRGKVTLVRWWTAGCPYCSATAPSLRALDAAYRQRGLVVVGIYHHKGDEPFNPRDYEDTAKKYGFTFPLAFDPEWKTLKAWLHGVDTGFTSVSFLVDRKGVVRYVHPGGEYVKGDAAYAKLSATIEQLLAEADPVAQAPRDAGGAVAAFRLAWDANRLKVRGARWNGIVHGRGGMEPSAREVTLRSYRRQVLDAGGRPDALFGELDDLDRPGRCWNVAWDTGLGGGLSGCVDAATGRLLFVWETPEG
jgi:peroxiredoxin